MITIQYHILVNPQAMGTLQTVSKLTATLIFYIVFSGHYRGCDYLYNQTTEVRIPVDPLSTATISPWDARDLPEVSWEADEGKQYTLIVLDVASAILHGLYINIEGNDITKAKVS